MLVLFNNSKNLSLDNNFVKFSHDPCLPTKNNYLYSKPGY